MIPDPQQVLTQAYTEFEQGNIAISFSGAEDVVLIDMASHICGSDFNVFSLDTGRLHPETYEFIEEVRQHYGVTIQMLMPNPQAVEHLVQTKGLFSFYNEGHLECCSIRKVAPLQRKLATLEAWTGQRRDQGQTRQTLPSRQFDASFSTPERTLLKFNPLANWTSKDIWEYIKKNHVPHNKLHDRGFLSIGCAPCTRPIKPGELERAGRWWWENEDDKECGLHAQNIQAIKLMRKS